MNRLVHGTIRVRALATAKGSVTAVPVRSARGLLTTTTMADASVVAQGPIRA